MNSNTNNDKRLIEVAFPLKQASIDSVHEKNVRHGHISTLHIWPARRPLAASRAALIATLLPDPGDKARRDEILKRLGGTLKQTLKKKKMPNGRTEEIEAWETEGGVLHWGRESDPDMDWFRKEIRKAYGGRAPRVLDPFAGGGAIPLEAMRLGCEVTAVDINPVAWFILKCTLEYPQKLAGQKRPLPAFALEDPEFMSAYLKAAGMAKAEITRHVRALQNNRPVVRVGDEGTAARGENLSLLQDAAIDPKLLDADLAWHVRAWGRWVLKQARRDLAKFYPTYAEYCSIKPYRRVDVDTGEPLRFVPVNDEGEPQVELLNAGFDAAWLENPKNPRWVAKPTVAYLWARTVRCKACHAEIPLLKTRWLAKKDKKRVLLTMTPRADKSGVEFGIDSNAKQQGGNAAQRREFDKKLGAGTMSRAGATCPCCGTIMTSEDLRLQGQADRMSETMTAVVVDSHGGKEYRLPNHSEVQATQEARALLEPFFSDIPHGLPVEPIPMGASRRGGGSPFTTPLYGLDQWHKLFTARQLITMASYSNIIRNARAEIASCGAYDSPQTEALSAFLQCGFDRMLDFNSSILAWITSVEAIGHTFARFALPMNWDFSEAAPINDVRGGWWMCLDAVGTSIETISLASNNIAPIPSVLNQSAIKCPNPGAFDVIVTDPPYYDAIPYSDLMDYFYVWDRRQLTDVTDRYREAFAQPLGPKWQTEERDGELIDDASRFGGDNEASKRNYEEGMARAFIACHRALNPSGRLVIVFAHKNPDAWETLVGAIIKAGFVVDGSWPIQTEQVARMRAQGAAALASSVWLVCKKRDPLAKAGWDTQVLKDMQAGITTKLRDFWDAGIRGPDFVWAATGPAMEAYSRYPAVKKASEPGQLMEVSEFLGHVRRMVVDFVVGRVLSKDQDGAAGVDQPLDDITTYYLLHRHDFGVKEAPAGPCILYAVSCGLIERELVDQYDVLARSGSAAADDSDEDDDDDDGSSSESSGGGKFKLKAWSARKGRSLGLETPSGRAIPLVDQVHKLMQLWVAGDVVKVNDYLDARGLRRSQVFAQLVQALIEQSRAEGVADECSILERLQNYLQTVGSKPAGEFGFN
jgi:adenine-specific DNA methylase